MVVPDDFGARLKSMRLARGMNQRQLAAALDGVVSQSGIARMENGQKVPTTSELLAMSWALGVGIDEFTDEVPLSKRRTWAARSEFTTDVSAALEQLTIQLQLRNTLDEVLRQRAS